MESAGDIVGQIIGYGLAIGLFAGVGIWLFKVQISYNKKADRRRLEREKYEKEQKRLTELATLPELIRLGLAFNKAKSECWYALKALEDGDLYDNLIAERRVKAKKTLQEKQYGVQDAKNDFFDVYQYAEPRVKAEAIYYNYFFLCEKTAPGRYGAYMTEELQYIYRLILKYGDGVYIRLTKDYIVEALLTEI